MTGYAVGFVNALALTQLDILGFSMSGFIAQAFALRHPKSSGD